jgi:hypothetical protein
MKFFLLELQVILLCLFARFFFFKLKPFFLRYRVSLFVYFWGFSNWILDTWSTGFLILFKSEAFQIESFTGFLTLFISEVDRFILWTEISWSVLQMVVVTGWGCQSSMMVICNKCIIILWKPFVVINDNLTIQFKGSILTRRDHIRQSPLMQVGHIIVLRF